jgi:hypothetical protein
MATLSIEGTRRFLLNLLPPGADKLYDLSPAGDVFKLFDGFAQTFKQFGFDLLELLRTEIFPSSAVQKAADWEKALGLAGSYVANSGTIAQRQTGILSKLREFGAFTPYLIRSIVAPLFGYTDFTQLRVFETSRAALTAIHTYVDAPPRGQGVIPANGNLTRPLFLPDGGTVSRAGAQVTVWLTHPALQGLTVRLVAPNGQAKTWANLGKGAVANQPFLLFGIAFAGAQCNVQWNLTVTDSSGNAGTLQQWQLFVEGVGASLPGPVGTGGGGLGGDIFDWGVFADPNLLGATQPPDYSNARFTINRIKHAHTLGHIIRTIAAIPDAPLSLPDQFIPG